MNWMIAAGALNGALAVMAGAFGAHGLKAKLTPELLATWGTGAEYHMYHALALVLVGVVAGAAPTGTINGAGIAMLVGIVLFSGSLYVLALTGVNYSLRYLKWSWLLRRYSHLIGRHDDPPVVRFDVLGKRPRPLAETGF